MDKINEIIDKIIYKVKENKLFVLIGVVLIIAIMSIVSIINKTKANKINSAPIVSIEVTCDYEFETDLDEFPDD